MNYQSDFSGIQARAQFTKRPLREDPEENRVSSLLPTIKSLTDHERRRYRLSNLIDAVGDHALAHRANPGCRPMEGTLETEIAQSLSKDLGVPPRGGFWAPLSIRASGLDTNLSSTGGSLVGSQVGDIIDALRAQSKILTLGAPLLSVRREVSFPFEDNVMTGSWVSENPASDVALSDPTFGQVIATAHNFQATTSYSRRLAEQSSADIEGWLRNHIARAHAQALDLAAVHGSGAVCEPVGLLASAGVAVVPIGADGGSPTATAINSLEKSVGLANGDGPSCGFLTNSTMRSRLRQTAEITNGVLPLWRDGTMLGYPAAVSNQVSATLVKGSSSDCSAIVFGNWSYLLMTEFQGAIEILVDRFSQKKKGLWEITSYGSYDICVTQPAAFSCIVDARDV